VALVVALPPWARKLIDKVCRAFLWKGQEEVRGGHCLVAWPRFCTPVEYGGLGITNLTLHGYALGLRWEWFRRTRPESLLGPIPGVDRAASAQHV
jgi:hypothetical protein